MTVTHATTTTNNTPKVKAKMINEWVLLKKSGYTQKDIAEQYNVSPSSVSYHLKSYQLSRIVRKGVGHKNSIGLEKQSRILSLIRQGLKTKVIADMVGVCMATVRKLKNDFGMAIRPSVDSVRQTIIRLRQRGKTYRQIGLAVGLSIATVGNVLASTQIPQSGYFHIRTQRAFMI